MSILRISTIPLPYPPPGIGQSNSGDPILSREEEEQNNNTSGVRETIITLITIKRHAQFQERVLMMTVNTPPI
ncbi:hypothetical protein JTE90_017919 [Oedothorax gibbosus]|uniref:Uncharacterized protein n=1 Tax=Oedothorax gibbosus TaxID=931172 RepID=A0AAV6VG32_9ARAC|nr:hypothetical protein JTE90_017919 [Oedothorax gibbosus]